MTLIKLLLFPLAVCIALLVSESGQRCLDEYWSATPNGAFPKAISSRGASDAVLDECTYLLCSLIAPGDDDDADDD